MKIEEQGKMTKEVDTALSNAQSLTEVECLVSSMGFTSRFGKHCACWFKPR